MTIRQLFKVVLVFAFALCVAAPQAGAQGLSSGLSVTPTGTMGNDGSFDVTLSTSFPLYYVVYPSAGRLGTQFYTNTYSAFFGLATMLNPAVNAIDYGDGGSPIAATTIPLATAGTPPGVPNVFRGSFTHTYPGPGAYTVTVGNSAFLGPVGSTFYPPTTGNPVTGNSVAFSQYSLFAGTTLYFTAALTFPFVWGLTNTAAIIIPDEPIVNVPAASGWGLLLLMVVLAGAGIALLRR